MEEKEPVTIEQIVNRLKSINKDELRERQFFQEVMSVINDMKNFELTEEDFEKFSTTLKEIGCVDYNSWLSERRSNDVDVKKKNIHIEIANGKISGAERMIENLLFDYNKARNTLSMINSNSQGKSWVEKWLKNSQNQTKDRKDDLQYETHAEGLLKQKKSSNREKEESEITSMEIERALLEAEKKDIIQQLESTKIKKKELMERLTQINIKLKELE